MTKPIKLTSEETITWEQITDDIKDADQLELFIENNIISQYHDFKEFFNAYVAENELVLSEIMKKSNIDKGYFYNIVNGDRQPKRDKIICLCVGAGMDVKHLNRALRLGKFSKLDPKDERDLRIKYAINNGVKDVVAINIMLEEADLDILA